MGVVLHADGAGANTRVDTKFRTDVGIVAFRVIINIRGAVSLWAAVHLDVHVNSGNAICRLPLDAGIRVGIDRESSVGVVFPLMGDRIAAARLVAIDAIGAISEMHFVVIGASVAVARRLFIAATTGGTVDAAVVPHRFARAKML